MYDTFSQILKKVLLYCDQAICWLFLGWIFAIGFIVSDNFKMVTTYLYGRFTYTAGPRTADSLTQQVPVLQIHLPSRSPYRRFTYPAGPRTADSLTQQIPVQRIHLPSRSPYRRFTYPADPRTADSLTQQVPVQRILSLWGTSAGVCRWSWCSQHKAYTQAESHRG